MVEDSGASFKPREAESVEVVSLMDNSVDFLSTVRREDVKNVREWMKEYRHLPMAEHGFSMLVRVSDGSKVHNILFDTGGSSNGVVVNARRMGIDLSKIECIVLSHGHYDHFAGLPAVVKAVGKNGLPVIVHEDMFKTRGVANPDGTIRSYPRFPSEKKIAPARYIEAKQPSLIADGLILVTGEIPRKTSFEKGFPRHRALMGGVWQPDPWIWDDRALVIHVKRKGLIILSGCAHAGIVNTTLYARQLTGVETVHAVLGGFHLAGEVSEPRINQTVHELEKMNPKLLAPSHCTGWRGIYAIANSMPKAFVWNSVGNLYVF